MEDRKDSLILMKKIIVATKNQGKVREMISAFKDLDVELHSLSEFGALPDAVEDGTTFAENALKKASFYAKETSCACLADDSGLEIDVLDGAPGIYSARFAGYHADDAANNRKMVDELAKKDVTSSRAHYVCALAFVDTDGSVLECEGRCTGQIRNFAKGDGGFGYDPYFYLPQLDKTMAQITLAEKNAVSHRGAALQNMENLLRGYLK